MIMNHLTATRHAIARKQQRGITDLQMQLVQVFGQDHYLKGGCTVAYVPEESIRRIRAALDTLGSVALIKSPEETVITVMHRTRKVRTTAYKA